MFSCGLAETTAKQVELKNISLKAFKSVLQYIYTGKLELVTPKPGELVDLLGLAHQYELRSLEKSVVIFMEQTVGSESVFTFLACSKLYEKPTLENVCLFWLDESITTMALVGEELATVSEVSDL